MEAVRAEGRQVITKALIHLMYTKQTGRKLSPEGYAELEQSADPESLARCIIQHPLTSIRILAVLAVDSPGKATMKQLYEFLATKSYKPVIVSQNLRQSSIEVEVFYLTLLHFLILNTKGNKMESAAARMNYED